MVWDRPKRNVRVGGHLPGCDPTKTEVGKKLASGLNYRRFRFFGIARNTHHHLYKRNLPV
jgi:hypothetical protein